MRDAGAIASFRDPDDEEFYFTGKSHRYSAFARVALRRLQELANAENLSDLGRVGGNRLEPLKGDRVGQHSIRINQQYRSVSSDESVRPMMSKLLTTTEVNGMSIPIDPNRRPPPIHPGEIHSRLAA